MNLEMIAWITPVDILDSTRYVRGRPHGSNWVKKWEVTVLFDDETEARLFMYRVNRKGQLTGKRKERKNAIAQ